MEMMAAAHEAIDRKQVFHFAVSSRTMLASEKPFSVML